MGNLDILIIQGLGLALDHVVAGANEEVAAIKPDPVNHTGAFIEAMQVVMLACGSWRRDELIADVVDPMHFLARTTEHVFVEDSAEEGLEKHDD